MISNLENYGQSFLEQFDGKRANKDATAKKALSSLQQFGFPTTKVESWRYTNIDEVLQQKLSFATKSTAKIDFESLRETHCELVFINGFFEPTLSNKKGEDTFELSSLSNLSEQQDFNELERIISTEAFANINLVYNHQVNLLKIKANEIVRRPLHIVHIHNDEKTLSLPRLVLCQGVNSEVTICESYISKVGGVVSAVNSIYLESNAKLTYYRFSSNKDNYYFNNTSIALERNAVATICSYNIGGKISRINLDIQFNGEGAYATADGLYTVRGSEKCDNRTQFCHHAIHTTSRQLFKGVLGDSSHGILNTKVFIDQDAQKVDSQQLSNNLLLSPMARVDAKPELDVKADDVKAGHGATVGQLSPEELFYLQSRGIDEQMALEMLLHSFVDEIILKIADEKFHQLIHNRCYKDFLREVELNK